MDAGRREYLARDSPCRNARGCFTRTGPLENVADVIAAVLRDARKVRVPGAGARDRRTMGTAGISGWVRLEAHRVLPIDPVAVLNGHRNGPADGLTMADARQNLRLVGFDGHPAPAAVAPLATTQFAIERVEIEFETRGDTFENHDQRAAVGLTSGEKAEHCGYFDTPARAFFQAS
jgi:hypothetical protein